MVEIIPKKPSKYPSLSNLLFYIALILFLFVVIAFFILNNSIKKSQESLKSLEQDLAKENTTENAALKKEVLDYQGKINDFSKLIDQHLANTEIFPLIEKKSHPKVWFSQATINSRGDTVSLSGYTQSFESLGQQLLIFREEALVKSAALEKVSIGKEGKIEFNLLLSFDPKIFSPVLPQEKE